MWWNRGKPMQELLLRLLLAEVHRIRVALEQLIPKPTKSLRIRLGKPIQK
jgi:hypothetical protein